MNADGVDSTEVEAAGVDVIAEEPARMNAAGVDVMAMDEQVCGIELDTLLRASDSLHPHVHQKRCSEVDVGVAVECTLVAD